MFGQKPVLNAGDEVLSFGGTPGTVSGSGSGTEGVLSTAARGDHSHALGEHDHSDSDHGGTLSLADIISGSEGNVLRYDSVNGWEVANNITVDDDGIVTLDNKLILTGTDSSTTEMPVIYFKTTADNHPLISYMTYTHDNMAIILDAYHDGSNWTSSYSGSNFSLYKNSNELTIKFNSGTAAGSSFSWASNGFKVDATGKASVGLQTGNAINAEFEIYSNEAGATDPLLYVFQDNASNSGYVGHIRNDGLGTALRITNYNAGSTSDAFWTVTYSTDSYPIRTTVYENSEDPAKAVYVRYRGSGVAGQDGDGLTALQFRGYNDKGNPEAVEYVRISTSIVDASDGTEGGGLALSTMAAGSLTETLRCDTGVVGIGSTTPASSAKRLYVYDDTNGATNPVLYVHQSNASNTGQVARFSTGGSGNCLSLINTNSGLVAGTVLYIESASSGAKVLASWTDGNDANPGLWQFVRRRASGVAGQNADGLAEINVIGYNDAGTPEAVTYGTLRFYISDASDGTEGGRIALAVADGVDGSLDTMIEISSSSLGFYGVTPTAQAAHISDPSGGGTQDAEARTAINAMLVALENVGITASA